MKRQNFNEGWKFGRQGEEKHGVLIPHDAMQEEKRSATAAGGSACAFFPGAVYEYEKTLTLPADGAAERLILQFDGVYQRSKVYVNDVEAGGYVYGYSPFFVDITDQVKAGEDNVIRVVADNSAQPNSRWYSGGGIYRSVWLWTGTTDAIAPEGVKVKTLSINPAKIQVRTERMEGASQDLTAAIEISCEGKTVASGEGFDVQIEIPDAKLWDVDTPDLYQCTVTLKKGGETVDEVSTLFGIREITYSNKGLFVNGKETLLRGGCVHHDNGILGAASFEESEWRRVKKLKEAGFNAIRSSHNPASPAMLDAWDARGM